MVEVFKTNVVWQFQAEIIVDQIHHAFNGYQANFDLEDCDRILRVACSGSQLSTELLISFLENLGCNAEVLPENSIILTDGNQELNY